MNKSDKIAMILRSLAADGSGIVINEQEVLERFNQRPSAESSLAIRILSVAGGVAGSLFFLAFLFFTGLYESAGGMIILGIISVITTVAVNTFVKNLLLDTVVISFYIIGVALLAVGCGSSGMKLTQVSLLLVLIAFLTLCIVRSYVFGFIAVLIITSSVGTINITNDNDQLIYVEIAVLVMIMVLMFIREANIRSIGNAGALLYHPIRTGLMISILGLLSLPGIGFLETRAGYLSWLPSCVAIIAVLWLAHRLVAIFGAVSEADFWPVYAIAALMLMPTIAAPGISVSLLIVLLSFYVNYKSGFVIGIVGFLYFLSRFYYDLNMTLLFKSLLLIAAGLLFFIFFLVTSKKFKSHEKS